jgi:CheY-like chemotaxis protein
LTSAPGCGATFTVRIPAASGIHPVDDAEQNPLPEGPVAGQLLVVDDEEEIAELIADQLARDGLIVDVATNGQVALDLVRARAYDLLIVDLRMPDMDGPQLISRLKRVAPALLSRVIVVTGDALAGELDAVVSSHGFPVLEKPLDLDMLKREVRHKLLSVASEPEDRGIHEAHAS